MRKIMQYFKQHKENLLIGAAMIPLGAFGGFIGSIGGAVHAHVSEISFVQCFQFAGIVGASMLPITLIVTVASDKIEKKISRKKLKNSEMINTVQNENAYDNTLDNSDLSISYGKDTIAVAKNSMTRDERISQLEALKNDVLSESNAESRDEKNKKKELIK